MPRQTHASEVENEILGSLSQEINDFKNTLPNDIKSYLENSLLDTDASSLLSNGLNVGKLTDYIIEYLFLGINKTLKSFTAILILLLISSIFNMLSSTIKNSSVSYAFNLCSSLTVALTAFKVCFSITENVTSYTKTLLNAMCSFAPIMAGVQIMAGKLTTATITNASMILFISIVDCLLVALMIPVIKICMMLSCVKSLGGIDFGGISKTLKTSFSSITVFIMSLFMFVFSMKNTLSQSADSLSLKTARFAISSFVPLVGASINEALRTVSASLNLIKNSCGITAILAILLIMLPIIIYVFLNKISFGILSCIAKIISCEKESTVLEEAGSICTYLLTIITCTCVFFIFSITIFIKTSLEVR